MQAGKIKSKWQIKASLLIASSIAAATIPQAVASVRPTVYPVLHPSAAVNLPITLGAPKVSTWRSRNGTIHLVAGGGVVIHVGYRVLEARQASIWLRPSNATGVSTFHAQIFLLGKVTVHDGPHDGTVLRASELLVSTHTQNTVELTQGPPHAAVLKTAAVYQKGALVIARAQAAPLAALYVPRIHILRLKRVYMALAIHRRGETLNSHAAGTDVVVRYIELIRREFDRFCSKLSLSQLQEFFSSHV